MAGLMASKLWAVRQALVDLFSATVDIPVYNGPVAQTDPPKEFILVGTDGGETGTGEIAGQGVESRQTWANLGINGNRQEEGEVVCAVWAWSGSTALDPLRHVTQAHVEALEAALLADKHLGGVLQRPGGWAEFGRLSLLEMQRNEGAVIRASFGVLYTARLAP